MNEITIYFTISESSENYSCKYCVNPVELKIEEHIPKKGFKKQYTIIKNIVTKHKYKIKEQEFNLNNFDKITFVSPIWYNKLASPVEQFIDANLEILKNKQVNIIAISSSGKDKVKELYENNFTLANFTSIANSQI